MILVFSAAIDVSFSESQIFLATLNPKAGLEIYEIPSGTRCHRLDVNSNAIAMDSHRSVPVLFIHRGQAILSGSQLGEAAFWDMRSGEKWQTLRHPGS